MIVNSRSVCTASRSIVLVSDIGPHLSLFPGHTDSERGLDDQTSPLSLVNRLQYSLTNQPPVNKSWSSYQLWLTGVAQYSYRMRIIPFIRVIVQHFTCANSNPGYGPATALRFGSTSNFSLPGLSPQFSNSPSHSSLLKCTTLHIALKVPIPVTANIAVMPLLALNSRRIRGHLFKEITHCDTIFPHHRRSQASLPSPDEVQALARWLAKIHLPPACFGVCNCRTDDGLCIR